ncbi:MAG: hypothetical protein GY805_25225 [Chloroflexi bacterium]|nr:hypothetical protein [Chloroflexota bacterium]
MIIDEARHVLDIGQLWENCLMDERLKAHEYNGRSVNSYFWRTYDQKKLT